MGFDVQIVLEVLSPDGDDATQPAGADIPCMTAHPEVIQTSWARVAEMNLASNASSSLVLVWVPIMDGWSIFTWMLYTGRAFYWFEWMQFFAMRVLVLSRMGSHTMMH